MSTTTIRLEDELKARIAAAARLCVLTGAGMSAESGIPTFRDAMTGLEGRDVREVATWDGFAADPLRVWQFYSERRRAMADVAPNAAHRALADQFASRTLHKEYVTLVIDGLHQAAGSERVVELHGNLMRSRCSACDRPPFEDREAYRAGVAPLCGRCRAAGKDAVLRPDVDVGQILQTSGPMGTFHHNPLFHGRELVFLAGGSGIVPARSMLLDMIERQLPWQFDVIYGNSFENDVIFQQELRELAQAHPNIRLTELVSRPTAGYRGRSGHVSADLLRQVLSGDLSRKMYYLCGPTPFNNNALAQLQQLGVPRRRIRVEANGAPKNPACLAQWPAGVMPQQEVTVTVQGKGSFRARSDEPLLNSLERNGYGAENACRSGECSLCRVKLVAGQVFNPPEARLRQSDRDFGWIHSCVAYPLQDIEILL